MASQQTSRRLHRMILMAEDHRAAGPFWHRVRILPVIYRVPLSFGTIVAVLLWKLAQGTKPRGIFPLCDPLAGVGVALVLVGVGLRSWAAGILRKNRSLTTTGPYRLCRHPLYLGSFLMMAGFALLIADIRLALVVVAAVLVIYSATIQDEEQRLSGNFGAVWDTYAAHAPRLFPRRWPTDLGSRWSLAQWLHNREYNAVVHSLAALAALELWRRAC
jgi:protein-S-isoprenylcysteine O-methyltransferase Ste14